MELNLKTGEVFTYYRLDPNTFQPDGSTSNIPRLPLTLRRIWGTSGSDTYREEGPSWETEIK